MCPVSSDRVVATILFSGFWTRHLDRLVDTAEWTADTATLTAPRPGCPRSRCCPAAGGSPSCRCRPGRRCRWRPWWRWRSRACWRGSCPSPRSTSCSPPGCRGWPIWGEGGWEVIADLECPRLKHSQFSKIFQRLHGKGKLRIEQE